LKFVVGHEKAQKTQSGRNWIPDRKASKQQSRIFATLREKLDADYAGYAEKYSHKEAQKAQRKISHGFHGFTRIF
jgi:hypothetical protein